MTEPVAWGVLGTGSIASQFAAAIQSIASGRLVAVGSRAAATASEFASRWSVAKSYDSYGAVIADAEVDAVYIATPHPGHKEWAIAAARAGKHILVEKPLTMSRADTIDVLAAAELSGVFLLEAFQYRSHPQTAALVHLLEGGAIGEVRVMEGSFGFHAPFDATSRLFDPALGGGAILDVGCYPVSMAALVAQTIGAVGTPTVTGGGRLGSTGVDEWAAATLVFDSGFVAQVSAATSVTLETCVRIFGTEGSITVPSPWSPYRAPGIVVRRRGRDDEVHEVDTHLKPFPLLIDTVAEHITARESPTMPWQDSIVIAGILDEWCNAVGVDYPYPSPVAPQS